ncbi:IQ calmodulin-binding motif domain-containing protein [Plectosphaerella plurivora]|uniref:IQ calmodulin-binding motif domain-containing protein n=1 Tax=Plectosphaerella plurivora TaxID=936078 RepID=A0A9P8VJN1_9PEZI|nr:IQ calmodulin-binding motif domain-containing protein [Plectosphaerella plurivora]
MTSSRPSDDAAAVLETIMDESDAAAPISGQQPTQYEDDDARDVNLMMPPSSDDEAAEHSEDNDDEGRIFAPPPHIAARFYRPTQTRRKDSAASSRRNSISSAQSRCSSSQAFSRHSGPQSKHVAQHLRRTSFLEDRKARLADRAAHAEKVRLRAALAKATPRTTTSSEERALAAQQAREKKLAEIVASCAEDVRKAKAVAESMKEKREQEQAKIRAKIADRQAEADRRREELRNRPTARRVRGHSDSSKKPLDVLPQVKEKSPPVYTPELAASKVQWWWRSMLRKGVVQDFASLGLTVDGIQQTDFDRVTELLAQDRVLVRTAQMLRICGLHEGAPGSVTEMAAVRTFLSAYVILGHPTQVLSSKDGGASESQVGSQWPQQFARDDLANPQAQSLVSKARDLLVSFETVLSRLTSSNAYTAPPKLLQTLPQAFVTFNNAFIAWKSRDSDSLVQLMLMQFVELDSIWQTVKDTSDDASMDPYRESIRENQTLLMVRIKRLAGPEQAKKMIAAAIKESRKARAAKKTVGDTKPRVAEPLEVPSASTAHSLLGTVPETLTPPATPSRRPVQETEAAPTLQPIILGPGVGGLFPPNRELVHEFAIDKEYRISVEEYRNFRKTSQTPLFEGMRAAMQTNDPDASFVFFAIMVRYFRDSLQRLVVPEASTYRIIGEMLDPEVAETQFRMGSFSYQNFFSTISTLLPKLCAPARDDEVKDLIENKLQVDDLVDRLQALTGFIDTMLCDFVNFKLASAKATLIQAAPQYEAKRFAEDIDNGKRQLVAATAAWRTARTAVMTETARRDPEGINHPKSRVTADRIYAQMLVGLFTQPLPVNEAAIPETLFMDHARVARVSLAAQRIVTAAAILLQCKNLMKRDVRSQWKLEAHRVMTVLEADHDTANTTVQGVMGAFEGRNMPADRKAHLRALVAKVVNASRDSTHGATEPREPVLRLLLARLRTYLLGRLGASTATEKVKAASTAGEKLAGLGLAEFAPQVRDIVEELTTIGKVDREAHTTWWSAVAEQVQAEDAAA